RPQGVRQAAAVRPGFLVLAEPRRVPERGRRAAEGDSGADRTGARDDARRRRGLRTKGLATMRSHFQAVQSWRHSVRPVPSRHPEPEPARPDPAPLSPRLAALLGGPLSRIMDGSATPEDDAILARAFGEEVLEDARADGLLPPSRQEVRQMETTAGR